MSLPKANPVVACLLGTLVLSGTCVGYHLWRTFQWRDQVRGLAGYQGEVRAKQDFEAGKLQLLVVGTPVTGSNGPYRLSGFGYHPGEGYPGRYAAEQYVEYYNKRMMALAAKKGLTNGLSQ